MDHRDAAGRQQFEREVAVGHGIERICGGRGEAEVPRQPRPINGETAAGQRPRPERRDIRPFEGILDATAVAVQHLHVGQEMVGEEDRLGPLGVRIARHHRVEVLLGPGDQCGLDARHGFEERGAGALDVEPEVNCDLVIAATAGVQLATKRA